MSETELNDIIIVSIIIVVLVILLILSIVIYFLPSIIACVRKHSNKLAIFLINLFTGATFLGWIAALVWAFIDSDNKIDKKPTVAQELIELAQLKEQGIISEEEFENKKNNLLNS